MSASAQPKAGAPLRRASLFGLIAAGANGVGTVGIVALMVLINADVFGRFLFNSPIAGVPEMVSLSIVGIVFLQVGHTLRTGRFIRSDMALGRLLAARPRAGRALQALHHATGAVLSGILLYFSARSFLDIWRNGDYRRHLRHLRSAGLAGVAHHRARLRYDARPVRCLRRARYRDRDRRAPGLGRSRRAGRRGRPVNEIIGLASVLGMLILIQTGMHIAIALLLLSFIGVWLIRGDFFVAGNMLALAARGKHRELFLRRHSAVRADGPVRQRLRRRARHLRCGEPALPARSRAGSAWRRSPPMRCSPRSPAPDRLGLGLHPDRRARNAATRLYAALLGRRGRRQLGARHADSAEPAADPLRHHRASTRSASCSSPASCPASLLAVVFCLTI